MVNIQSALMKFNPKFQWNAIIIKALNHQSVSHRFTFEADYSCFTNTVFRNTQKTVTSFTLLATSAEHIFNQPIYPFKSNILFFHYAHNIHTLHTQIYTTSCQNTSHTKENDNLNIHNPTPSPISKVTVTYRANHPDLPSGPLHPDPPQEGPASHPELCPAVPHPGPPKPYHPEMALPETWAAPLQGLLAAEYINTMLSTLLSTLTRQWYCCEAKVANITRYMTAELYIAVMVKWQGG